MPDRAPDRPPRWLPVLGALLGLHLLLGIARLPGIVVARRLRDVAEHRERGAAGYFLGGPHLRGAEVIGWLQANVPPDAAVLFRGPGKGALEFAPALLAPRLLVQAAACPPGARAHGGRELATRARPDGSRAVLVLAGERELRLEDR